MLIVYKKNAIIIDKLNDVLKDMDKMAETKKKSPNNKKSTQNSRGNASSAKKPVAKNNSKKHNDKSLANKQIISCILFAVALFWFCVIVIPSGVGADENNAWHSIKNGFFAIFGMCACAIPPMLIYASVGIAKDKPINNIAVRLGGIGAALLMLSSLLHIFSHKAIYLKEVSLSEQVTEAWDKGFNFINSGVFGSFFGGLISGWFGKWGAVVTMFIVLFVLIMLLTGVTMSRLIEFFSSVFYRASDSVQERIAERENNRPKSPERRKTLKKDDEEYKIPQSEDVFDDDYNDSSKEITRSRKHSVKAAEVVPVDFVDVTDVSEETPDVPSFEPMPVPDFAVTNSSDVGAEKAQETVDNNGNVLPFEVDEQHKEPADIPISKKPVKDAEEVIKLINNANEEKLEQTADGEETGDNTEDEPEREYVLPDVECLAQAQSYGDADIKEELTANANKLVETLRSFNIETKIVDIARGPSVTRYEIQPAPGIKISRIANLADDIAMNLAASGVRIEAPIPNKAAVGIEIPNKTRLTVSLREIIDSPQFKSATSKLNVALGKDISGNVTCTDLAKMPHLLIAGTTGSGKSVCLNAMIISILFNSNPDEVKLIMIDPKQVEFTVYRDIPHLMVPVVSDPRKAAGALAWAVSEMTKRYKMFSEKGVRDIKGYNKMAAKDPEMTPMYQIVIFIDELSDLMMVAQNEVEDSICRLAQMARAAGMHLVIATQRPSVNVITGIIKANIPSRIALFVSSQVDSRTIIDTAGAEKLLGNGDMLFNPVGVSKPVRLQGCYVSDEEVERVVDFIKAQGECEYDNDVMEEIEKQAVAEKKKEGYHVDADASPDSGADEETMKAIAVVVEHQMASTTLLQRKLKIGYAKAARIMDELEEKGVIGPFEGSKPRKVLMSKQQFNEMRALNDLDGFVGVDSGNSSEE